jgi:DNA sulfur modification protein DndE
VTHPKTIRVVETDKDLLSRLKRHTGVKGYNTLCRWGYCMSLADPNPTSVDPLGAASSLEIDWEVFAGAYKDVYWALLVQRVSEDGLDRDDATLHREFYRHLHRGLGQLANVAQRPTSRDILLRIA